MLGILYDLAKIDIDQLGRQKVSTSDHLEMERSNILQDTSFIL